MALANRVLSESSRLSLAANNGAPLRTGERGDAVQRLQLALIAAGIVLPRSTAEQSAFPDGIFGTETDAAVRNLQRSQALKIDGIVGPKTLAKLDELQPTSNPKSGCCCNGKPGNAERAMSLISGANFGSSVGGVSLPTGVRFLTASQQAAVRSVFGSSLDFTRIVLTNATGIGGRPFTVAVGIPGLSTFGGPHVVVINAGSFSPSNNLLIHELTHAWQSQHSFDPKRFMINSAASQGIADELLSRFGVDASAYYYKPGKHFSLYGAEQIACQVESGVTAIIASLPTFPPHIPFPFNEVSLSLPRWEVRGAGVVTTC